MSVIETRDLTHYYGATVGIEGLGLRDVAVLLGVFVLTTGAAFVEFRRQDV